MVVLFSGLLFVLCSVLLSSSTKLVRVRARKARDNDNHDVCALPNDQPGGADGEIMLGLRLCVWWCVRRDRRLYMCLTGDRSGDSGRYVWSVCCLNWRRDFWAGPGLGNWT